MTPLLTAVTAILIAIASVPVAVTAILIPETTLPMGEDERASPRGDAPLRDAFERTAGERRANDASGDAR